MARQVDENKINAIKKATVETVVIDGISGASISKIASKAGVSVGYLYRFYKGKRELLEALFEERFQMINNLLLDQVYTQNSVEDIVTFFVKTIYEIANTRPQSISFTHKLLSDFSFELPKEFKKDVTNICQRLIKLGHKTGEIDADITDEIIYVLLVGGVLNFVNIRQRRIFEDKEFTQEDVVKTTELLLKALSPNSKNSN
ncbi:TetR family transcriptional regulator [Balneicella halophila]|uniref:TetR family transcriptional regulator n=1 Tax=Balneicella halophila TaxID=1537566 RepID=A0A7L4UQC0_BALHA|nr:TetR/AcrR family transcriptional regulator [Balneicella halophila]PVX51950.1 TetR family transcriptional regulator [Balneicella halophila]